MKKILVSVLCVSICVCCMISSLAEGRAIEAYRSISTNSEGWKTFHQNHPEIELNYSTADYTTTSAIAGALLTGEFESDIFSMTNLFFDYQQIMKKGYCADLSQSEIITEAVQRMHPAIQEQVMVEGKLYALPISISFSYWKIVRNTWEKAGLSTTDIPDTLDELFDFLEDWCDRIERSPEPEISVWNAWDMTVYNASSYTQMFTEWVIDNYIMQRQFQEAELQFDANILLPLLTRCNEIGSRLYQLEYHSAGAEHIGASLFEPISRPRWPENTEDVVFMRLNKTQPKLVKAKLTMYSVNASSEQAALCIELLENTALTSPDEYVMLLNQDAFAIPDPQYEELRAAAQRNVDNTEAKLASNNLDAATRAELEDHLEKYRSVLSGYNSDEKKYIMTPTQMEQYHHYVDMLYFDMPNEFSPDSPNYSSLRNLEKQFSSGVITADHFLNELSRIAYMIWMENE